MRFISLACACALSVTGEVIDFEADVGAIANEDGSSWKNGALLNATLASLKAGDTLYFPNKTFHLMGGIWVDNVKSVVIKIDGTLKFSDDIDQWPRMASGKIKNGDVEVLPCWYGENWEDVTFTSSAVGTLDGSGDKWWGLPAIGYAVLGENRPRLIHLNYGKNIKFEKIYFLNSPYWTFYMTHVDGLEVDNCEISNRRTTDDGHGLVDITAFNTDGFDVTGKNVWIHDSKIWTQDDCIAVKSDHPSENMVFERLEASGLGLTIGSISGSAVVRNITFRDINMHKTVKGIYFKFMGSATGSISDIVMENIYMYQPSQYPIWIGPAQQADDVNVCHANPCSLCWPSVPLAECKTGNALYADITLRNITVDTPNGSPGVLFGSPSKPMQNIIFEDVVIKNPGTSPFDDYYYCSDVATGIAKGSTWPVPPCFEDQTGTCIADGSCTKDGRTCCSGRQYSTLNCGSWSRCGCVDAGDCATSEEDCCSGTGHKTLACNAGVGVRCDASQTLV